MVTLVNIMVMDECLTSFALHVNRPSHYWHKVISDSDLETPKGQGHWYGERLRSNSWPSILLNYYLFISHQSDQQSLRYSYFKIWPWNIQGQGHEWGQSSRSYIIPSIQPMHLLSVSRQSDKSFLRYGQIVSILTKHIWNFIKNCYNNSFQQNVSEIYSGNTHD